jgi:hypothetical protein
MKITMLTIFKLSSCFYFLKHLTLKWLGRLIVPFLARFRLFGKKLLIERTQIVIVNSSIYVAVVFTPF